MGGSGTGVEVGASGVEVAGPAARTASVGDEVRVAVAGAAPDVRVAVGNSRSGVRSRVGVGVAVPNREQRQTKKAKIIRATTPPRRLWPKKVPLIPMTCLLTQSYYTTV